MRYEIYCDMDGTLTDFEGMSHKLFGERFEPPNPKIPLPEKIAHVKRVPDFWTAMQWLHDAKALWNYIARHNPHILSAYALWDLDRCLTGKTHWVMRNLRTVPLGRIHLVHREEKRKFARSQHPDTVHILIDDYHKNISEWTSAGGHAIYHTSASQSIAALKALGL